jgi:sialidase-1
MVLLEDPGEFWSAANPATVVDRGNGRIWVFYLRSRPGRSTETSRPGTDDMQTLARWCDDSGLTWSKPMDLTGVARDLKDPNWRASVPGPGGAIQIKTGRLLVPFWKYPFDNFVLYSDDHGSTWRRGGLVPTTQGGNENQLVELADGSILMDIRQSAGSHRWLSVSRDGGQTWQSPRPGQTVSAVACAIERLGSRATAARQDLLVWTGPAGPGRSRLVLFTSDNNGATFERQRLISDGYAAYSDLSMLKDGSLGILWERGVERGYQFITFTRVRHALIER